MTCQSSQRFGYVACFVPWRFGAANGRGEGLADLEPMQTPAARRSRRSCVRGLIVRLKRPPAREPLHSGQMLLGIGACHNAGIVHRALNATGAVLVIVCVCVAGNLWHVPFVDPFGLMRMPLAQNIIFLRGGPSLALHCRADMSRLVLELFSHLMFLLCMVL